MDDALLTEAKRRALETGRSLGSLIEEAVRHELERGRAPEDARKFKVEPFHGTGLVPGVDLDNTFDLLDRMESL